MTEIQQVIWALETEYLGHPYYVTGSAIYHALGLELPTDAHRHIHASHGLFVPGQFGTFPDAHSQEGANPNMGATLAPVETYADLFLLRKPASPWLLDSRPRDALNVHPLRSHRGHVGLAGETSVGRPADARVDARRTSWYVAAFLHADRSGILPIADPHLDGLQFGGERNFGYGQTRLQDTQMVDLAALEYDAVRAADAHCIELVTPYVLRSEYPATNDVALPWWWSVGDERRLRHRQAKLVEGADVFRCETIDHGQVVGYTGDRPVETAKNGITRVGPHSKYGFGELRVIPMETAT